MSSETHARLTSLFGKAIELTAAARAELIERVRADDPALAGELLALLEADRLEVAALATGALGEREAATKPEGPRARPNAPAIPGYRICGLLGEGGMGTVYEAEQEAPRRIVAIKVLRASSNAALFRFRTEVEVMARLDHPGIAKIFEAGHAGGHSYFVMERVDGVTLDAYVANQPRRTRLELFAAVCDAVHHAHIKGVFHRDLKPSNILVRSDGRVIVLDFGIARLAEGDSQTRAGELMGTPVYMSPEQARLRADEVDARSDVYTLGVILYELLSGSLPYEVRDKPLPEIARVICDEPPRSLARFDRTLRGDLEAICDRALAKTPERRYTSAAAVAEDVRQHLAGARVSVRVPSAAEQLRRFVRRRPGISASIAAGVLGAVAVTALWLEARAARHVAERERARVVAAHELLEARTNQLLLDEARDALSTDPTRSLALLRSVTARGLDVHAAWAIADEAFGRGVAREVVQAHDDEARWVEPAPAGFVTAGYDGRILRWAGGEANELARFDAHAHAVRPSPDGRLFAIGFDRGIARIVDERGQVVAAPGLLLGEIERVAWSPDGMQVAFADESGTVVVWDRATASERKIVDADSGVESLAWAADSAALAIGTEAGAVVHWDRARGRTRAAATGAEALAVWCRGDGMAAISADGRLWRWELRDERWTALAEIATGIVGKVAVFTPDGTRALIGGVDGRIAQISDTGVQELAAHPRQVRALAASSDGRRFASASDDGLVRVWDLERSRTLTLRGHVQRVRHVMFAAGGSELLSADSTGAVRRWALDGVATTVFEPASSIVRVAVAPDGASLVTAGATGELRRFSLATGTDEHIGEHAHVTALASSAGARAVAVAAENETITWWHAAPVRARVASAVRAIAIAHERWVAVATAAGPIELYSLAGEHLGTLAGHAGGSEALAWSPDGTLLISGGQDRVVRAWRPAASTAPVQEIAALDGDTRHVVFARAGTIVATGGDDGKVRTWTVRDGALDTASQRVVATHRGAVIALATDGDERLVSVGRDRVRIELDLARGDVVRTLVETASQPVEGGVESLRGVRLPLTGGRELTIDPAGRTVVVHLGGPRDLESLRARLAM